MDKPFAVQVELSPKLLTLIYLCYEHSLPMSLVIAFYEMYKDNAFYILRALNCCGKLKVTDVLISKALEESRLFYKEILRGVSVRVKISNLKFKNPHNEEIPQPPELNLSGLSTSYQKFVSDYLLNSIDDIYAERITLRLSTTDLYEGAHCAIPS